MRLNRLFFSMACVTVSMILLSGTMNDDSSDGDVSVELRGLVDAWYPRELELYFRRTYTHPVTGRKGVVAILSLRK